MNMFLRIEVGRGTNRLLGSEAKEHFSKMSPIPVVGASAASVYGQAAASRLQEELFQKEPRPGAELMHTRWERAGTLSPSQIMFFKHYKSNHRGRAQIISLNLSHLEVGLVNKRKINKSKNKGPTMQYRLGTLCAVFTSVSRVIL